MKHKDNIINFIKQQQRMINKRIFITSLFPCAMIIFLQLQLFALYNKVTVELINHSHIKNFYPISIIGQSAIILLISTCFLILRYKKYYISEITATRNLDINLKFKEQLTTAYEIIKNHKASKKYNELLMTKVSIFLTKLNKKEKLLTIKVPKNYSLTVTNFVIMLLFIFIYQIELKLTASPQQKLVNNIKFLNEKYIKNKHKITLNKNKKKSSLIRKNNSLKKLQDALKSKISQKKKDKFNNQNKENNIKELKINFNDNFNARDNVNELILKKTSEQFANNSNNSPSNLGVKINFFMNNIQDTKDKIHNQNKTKLNIASNYNNEQFNINKQNKNEKKSQSQISSANKSLSLIQQQIAQKGQQSNKSSQNGDGGGTQKANNKKRGAASILNLPMQKDYIYGFSNDNIFRNKELYLRPNNSKKLEETIKTNGGQYKLKKIYSDEDTFINNNTKSLQNFYLQIRELKQINGV